MNNDPRPLQHPLAPTPQVDLPGQRERRDLERRELEAREVIARHYPFRGQLIKLRSKSGGVFATGFDSAITALVNGNCELVIP